MHDGICSNPLDMSQSRYAKREKTARPPPQPATRDMNPLACPLSRRTSFLHTEAHDILEGKVTDIEERRERNKEILHKYARYVLVKACILASQTPTIVLIRVIIYM